MTDELGDVIGGVDTHGDTHHAVVIDGAGRVLGSREFRSTERGCSPTHPDGHHLTMAVRLRRSDFRLAIRVIPFAAAAVLAKLAVHALGWDDVELNTLHSGLLAANVFLIGFLLAGTLSDFKESERLPGELAGRAETIADECQILYRDRRSDVARRALEHMGNLAAALLGWLRGAHPVDVPLALIEELNDYFLAFQPLTQPNFIVRLKQEQSALRLLVFRINTIKETSFVGAGYVIAVIASVLLVIALVFADIAPLGTELFLLGSISFLFGYMILLIRDLDDPFDYDENGRRGAVEVSLAPLEYMAQRIATEATTITSEEYPPDAAD